MTPEKHIEPLLRQIQANHGPWCGRCGKPMTPANSTVAPELFLCDSCANESGIAPPVAQERPQTALGEAHEYHTRRAKHFQQAADYHLSKGDPKFANAYLADAEFHKRLATACREAD